MGDTASTLAEGTGGLIAQKLASMLGGPWGMLAGFGGPLLLSALFGGKGEDAMTMRKKAMEFLDPYAILNEQNNQYAQLLNSPAVAAARAQAIQGGQAGAQAINARLGQTGLGRSGVGMALEGAVRAAPDIQIAQMLGGLHDTAAQRALDIQKMRAQQRMSGQPQNSMVRDMSGAMLASILPAVLNYKGPSTTKTNQRVNPNNALLPAGNNAAFGARLTPAQEFGRGVEAMYGGTNFKLQNRVVFPKPDYFPKTDYMIKNGFKKAALSLQPYQQMRNVPGHNPMPGFSNWFANMPWGN